MWVRVCVQVFNVWMCFGLSVCHVCVSLYVTVFVSVYESMQVTTCVLLSACAMVIEFV